MNVNRTKQGCYYLILTLFIVFTSITAEAGLLSGLMKLGKKVDTPDAHLSSFRFADDLAHYPDGSVAEIHFSSSQNQWLAKTPDGKSVSIEQFSIDVVGANKQATLLLSERNLPHSLDALNRLPAGAAIKIMSRNGKGFSFISDPQASKLVDRNISIAVSDMPALKAALWQLQRPLTSSKIRLVHLADNADVALAAQGYGSKIAVDAVGANNMLDVVTSMRQQTLVISAKVDNGLLVQGKHKIALADLEAAAAKRDVNLIILGSDNPKKTLLKLSKDWQQKHDAGGLLSYSAGDFFNAFSSKDVVDSVPIEIAASGQLRTALHFEHKTAPTAAPLENSAVELVTLPLHVLIKSASLYRPVQARSEELDRRIHPAIPSDLHFALLVSFLIGFFTLQTSWWLYKKLWDSPRRINCSNGFVFSLLYLLHRLSFLMLYLPLLGFISPIYLIVKWTVQSIHFLVIRPVRWLLSKVM